MTRPARYDLSVKRRADCILRLQFKDASRQPINLTGFDVAAQVWDQARTLKYADFTVDFIDRLAGKVNLRLFPHETEALPDDSWYDVLLVDPSGTKDYQIEGIIYAHEGYTEET